MNYGFVGQSFIYCVADGVDPPKGSIPCADRPDGSYILSDNGDWIPDLEAMKIEARRIRNELLFETDWTQVLDSPLSVAEKANWASYRQSLRDISLQNGFPLNISWPEKPFVERNA